MTKYEFREIGELYDKLIELGLFTEAELDLVTNISGYSVETLNDCIYARYGYRDLEQMLDQDYDLNK